MKKLLTILFFFQIFILSSQVDIQFQKPHKDILKLVDAPLPPQLLLNTEATNAVLIYRHPFRTIAELSEHELRLAGLRINPDTYFSSRRRTYFKIKILDILQGKEYELEGLPENGRYSNFSRSPDEKKIAFTQTTDKGVQLWVLDIQSKTAKQLTEARLNATIGNPCIWFKNSNALLINMRGTDEVELIDSRSAIPTGPTVSVNAGQEAQNRTYQDLLKNKADEHNFESLVTSELYKIDLEGNKMQWLGPKMYRDVSFSPDGNFVLVETIKRPFSYLVPYYRFPTLTQVYDHQGNLVNDIHETGLIEEIPKGRMAVTTGKRNINWRRDKPATIYWVEALDEGDPSKEVEYRDAVFEQKIPVNNAPKQVLKTIDRYSGITWGTESVAIATDRWWKNRNTRTYLFHPGDSSVEPRILFERNYQDRYGDPGDFVTEKNEYGQNTLVHSNNHLFLFGDGYSDKGIHPFVDQIDLNSGKTKRLWQAEENERLENIISAVDIRSGKIVTRIEGKTEYPNYFMRDIFSTGRPKKITDFENPYESLAGVHKEIIKYKRDDGVDLSGTLYLPAGYKIGNDEKLPMLMWAYPREYKDKQSAGQISSSEYQFTYPSYGSPIFWVLRGFAVLDRAAFPILGEGQEEPNDKFVIQLVANAKAAIDAVDKIGCIDREKVAVGGHSYGAFMTANLLSHSDLFAAGIARSGAYNRTLTPFGFQSEVRTYWDAPNIYYEMSPFMHADEMKTPLLLIHGEADNNSGTYPMQSIRYFNALKGLGATVRLVMLPRESHGYAAKESIFHLLWEQDQWLEKYVKNKDKLAASRP